MRQSRSVLFALVLVPSMLALVLLGADGPRQERQLLEAHSLLHPPLATAPELRDIDCVGALTVLEDVDSSVGAPLRRYADAVSHYQRGSRLMVEGAISAARRSSGWTPELRVLAAALHRDAGDFATAMDHVRAALALHPDHPRALLMYADLSLDVGDAQPALAALQRLVTIEPDAGSVHSRLGLALEALGRSGARECFVRATELDPGLHDAWVNLARSSLAAGDIDEARSAFRRAVRLQSGDAQAHLGVGLCDLRDGALDAARSALGRAVELEPCLAHAHHALGDLARMQGRLEEAVAAHRRGARCSDDPLGWVKLGNALAEHGELAGALAAFEAGIARQGGLAAAHNGLGVVLMRRGLPGDHTRAESAFLHAAALDPSDENPQRNLTLLRARAGRTRLAAR